MLQTTLQAFDEYQLTVEAEQHANISIQHITGSLRVENTLHQPPTVFKIFSK